MATLLEIWETPRNITHVAKRPSGVYVSLAHKSADAALDHARAAQTVTSDDVIADDWEKAEAP